MGFTKQEVVAIIHSHVVEKMGVDPGAAKNIRFACSANKDSGLFDLIAVEVEVETEKAVPKGPYRTRPAYGAARAAQAAASAAYDGRGGGDMAGSKIVSMGRFTAIGMRARVKDPRALVINTCGQNDTAERGSFESWVWSNPTNRAVGHEYCGVKAVSVECLWQGTKVFREGGVPDEITLAGDWRRGKAKKPVGAWAGEGQPLIRTPGEARRRIYVPAFKRLVEHWLSDETVAEWVRRAREHDGPVFLRDHDTGRGIDRRGPLSHA